MNDILDVKGSYKVVTMYSRLKEMEISRRIIKMSLRFQKW